MQLSKKHCGRVCTGSENLHSFPVSCLGSMLVRPDRSVSCQTVASEQCCKSSLQEPRQQVAKGFGSPADLGVVGSFWSVAPCYLPTVRRSYRAAFTLPIRTLHAEHSCGDERAAHRSYLPSVALLRVERRCLSTIQGRAGGSFKTPALNNPPSPVLCKISACSGPPYRRSLSLKVSCESASAVNQSHTVYNRGTQRNRKSVRQTRIATGRSSVLGRVLSYQHPAFLSNSQARLGNFKRHAREARP